MAQLNYQDTNSFLCPRSHYYGQVKPENLVFNANLQEFAQRVSYITSLETGGKLSTEEAFGKIEALWEKLESSKNKLGIGSDISLE
ncbi:MAG: hypothetical protein V7K69_00200 [Nostoc sp.]|uniref:DUF7219 family protein n=1 Tax=Nostoc sp. TaxID=1180 RepID=UPI002FFCE610